jgi:DNA-binding SARP family transcriptional activator
MWPTWRAGSVAEGAERAMALCISLTGALALERDGEMVDGSHLGGRRPRRAFALLVLDRHHPIPADELARAVWPERLPDAWERELCGVIGRVRGFLGAAPAAELRSDASSHHLLLPAGTAVDLEVCEAEVAAAESALAADDVSAAVERAGAARELALRPFLPGEEGGWIERVRVRRRATMGRCLGVLGEARLRRGHLLLAASAAEARIALDPLREESHRQLMRIFAAAGDREAALRAYERLRRVLAADAQLRGALR